MLSFFFLVGEGGFLGSERKFWTRDSGRQTLYAGRCRWTLNAGLWTLDYGHWTLDAGCWTLVVGLWTLDSELWTLDSGHWTLDAEHQTVDVITLKFKTVQSIGPISIELHNGAISITSFLNPTLIESLWSFRV